MRNTLGFLFVGAMLASAATMAGCGGDVTNNSDDMGGGGGDMAVAAENPCSTGVICTAGQIEAQSLELFAASSTSVKVQAAPGYSGMVKATFERSAIDKLSGGVDPFVSIVAVPGIFALSAGQPVNLFLKFATTTDAAAFADQTITLHLADADDATKSFDLPFKMTVKPTLTVSYSGAGTALSPQSWSTDQLANKLAISVRQRAVTNMVGGTTFIFQNKDTNPIPSIAMVL